VHTVAHILNAEYYVEAYNERIIMVKSDSDVSDEQKIKTLLLKLSKETDVNPMKVANSNPILESLKLAAGVTGVVLCIILLILISSSSKFIRRSFYNVFWYFHQFGAVIYFLAIAAHGIQGH
jgi:NADPH oxidase